MKKIILTFLLVGLAFSFANPVKAQSVAEQYEDVQEQGLIFAGICDSANDPCECRDYGKCELEDMLQLLINLSTFIFGISGSVLLLVFVYGGFTWLIAQGKAEAIERGKQAMVGGLVGLAIILGAYVAINVIVSVLKTGEIPTSDIEETIGGGSEDIIETQ